MFALVMSLNERWPIHCRVAALYDMTPDWHGILNELPSAKGLYCAAGGNGHSLKLAPAVRGMMAEFVLNGKREGDDIDLFGYRRFSEGRYIIGK